MIRVYDSVDCQGIFEEYYLDTAYHKKVSLKTMSSQSPKHGSAGITRKYFSVTLNKAKWHGTRSVLVTLKDTTSNKLVVEKELVDRIKSMIFKSFSHEMHTPLNGIILNLQTIKIVVEQAKKDRSLSGVVVDPF